MLLRCVFLRIAADCLLFYSLHCFFTNRSSSKSQGSCSSPTSDYPPSMSGASSRRISSRSFTESYILPTKTSSTSVSSSSIPTSTSVTSSISNTFVTRYSVRHYHQVNELLSCVLLNNDLAKSGSKKDLIICLMRESNPKFCIYPVLLICRITGCLVKR